MHKIGFNQRPGPKKTFTQKQKTKGGYFLQLVCLCGAFFFFKDDVCMLSARCLMVDPQLSSDQLGPLVKIAV